MRRYAAPLAVPLVSLLALALAGCAGSDQRPAADSRPTSTPASTPSSTDATGPAGSPTGASTEPSASSSGGALPAAGTPASPAVVTAGKDPLDWSRVPGPVDDTVTRSGRWTLTVDEAGTKAEIAGPHGSSDPAGSGQRISDALIDGHWAVVVHQDKAEQRPARAVVTELAIGDRFTLDGSSDLPTVGGGTWALGDGHLLHATVHAGRYCVATVDLATKASVLGWCVPPRHGFNAARITPHGDSVLSFDAGRPSCRTVGHVDGIELRPFPGVPDCKAWEGLLTGDGAVWSVIPKENNVETAHFYARSGDGYYDLGPGTSGSLTWCGDAAWFVRDPQRDGDPAALMRWRSSDGLQAVYESPGGQAFLAAPRCGGDTMTVTALAEGGDEQVSAPVR